MDITIHPQKLQGGITVIPSKSQAHRMLICSAFADKPTKLICPETNLDMEATADCLRALGAAITIDGDTVTLQPQGFMQAEHPVLECRESGSTLRFFIPLALCLGRPVVFHGSQRLLERPLDVYEELCREGDSVLKRTGTE